uniref:Serpin B6 n=1 Tax=Xiphophorus couchianus TaxID=32473 RepID=A0A3B5LSI9_9TELE
MASSIPLSKPNTTFSLALLRKLSEDKKTANIFFSPFSISSALAMVMLGARGDTATQISEVISYFDFWSMLSCTELYFSVNCQDDVHILFAKTRSELNKPDAKFVLSVANRLFGEKSYSFLQMVLVNAIYFKGNWNAAFQRSNTREILEIPYEGKALSMLIFLPRQIEDNETGLKKVGLSTFMEWTHPREMESGEIIVKMPRFKLEEKYDLNRVLSSMGMVDAFHETKCDFSGMSSNKGLFLSQVSHKAFVEVNEEGTEAAAATGGLVADSVSFFTADHPFLFFIRHRITKTILFAGRFCSP